MDHLSGKVEGSHSAPRKYLTDEEEAELDEFLVTDMMHFPPMFLFDCGQYRSDEELSIEPFHTWTRGSGCGRLNTQQQ